MSGPATRHRVAMPRADAGRVDVILLGPGAIGRELLVQLARGSASGSPLRVRAVIDRSGYVERDGGLSRERILEVVACKRAGGSVASLGGACAADAGAALEALATRPLSRPVLVDATAADTTDLLGISLTRGWDLVLANKTPMAGSQASADELTRLAFVHGGRILHEATVGAGLPVIDTVRKLLETGDRITRIEGCPSGTLGYLFGELGRGSTFSASLRRAIAAGYAEPDPRVDLSGLDVARKAIILARLIGFRGDLRDVAVESLVPPELAAASPAEFLERVAELDAPWAARVRAAAARGKVLRYRARVTSRSVAVELVAVASSDPLASLSGTDNQFAFTTVRYRAQPLVIRGLGAGSAITAAGVHNDLLRLALTASSAGSAGGHERVREVTPSGPTPVSDRALLASIVLS